MAYTRYTNAVSTRDRVYASLREQILNLDLPPGTPLSENETSQLFQVSRTPVRESFMRLAQEGLVQVLPQRGTFVSLIDLELIEEARFMREHLESAVIKLACEHFQETALIRIEDNLRQQLHHISALNEEGMFELDQEFHRLLFEGCGKLHTWGAMAQLTIHLIRIRRLKMSTDPNWSHLYEQHRDMVDFIKAGNSAAAEALLKAHLQLNVTDQALLKQKYPHYFQ